MEERPRARRVDEDPRSPGSRRDRYLDDEPRRPRRDPGLSGGAYALFALLFLAIPMVNVLVSSILYYVWKGDEPRKAGQINTLGFIVFGVHVALYAAIMLVFKGRLF